MQIDVCIATFRRPTLLGRLLADVQSQVLPDGIRVHTIVVDNDPLGSAHPIVLAGQLAGMSLEYLTQHERNIALSRNCALAHSRGELIAFVDDDERAPKWWLSALLSAMERHHADVVLGPVTGIPPEGTPAWITKGRFFVPPVLESGTRVRFGGTGNALVKSSVVQGKVAFDPLYGVTGGEDTDFFYNLWRTGAVMVWCQEAELTEGLPWERLTARYLLRRGFGAGQRYADIVERPNVGLRWAGWFAKRTSFALAAVFLAIGSIPCGKAIVMRFAVKVATNLGQLSTIFRYRQELYRV